MINDIWDILFTHLLLYNILAPNVKINTATTDEITTNIMAIVDDAEADENVLPLFKCV